MMSRKHGKRTVSSQPPRAREAQRLTAFEVFSWPSYDEAREEVHGLMFIWNAPGAEGGAVQLRDAVVEWYFRRKRNAHVGIRERQMLVVNGRLIPSR